MSDCRLCNRPTPLVVPVPWIDGTDIRVAVCESCQTAVAAHVAAERDKVPAAVLAELTDRQRAIFDWIVAYHRRGEGSPTIREIMAHFGIRSTNGVICTLKALEKKGAILNRGDKKSRSIRLARGKS